MGPAAELEPGRKEPVPTSFGERLKSSGKISYHDFMGGWLDTYYAQHAVIGDSDRSISMKQVDFSTSPEISPLFGFLVGRQILEMWESMGRPADFRIIEMGGGNGTLAHDVLHGIHHYQELQGQNPVTLPYTIVEKSPSFVETQRERLRNYPVEVVHGSAVELPGINNVTGVFLSNELPDAFPIHPIRKQNGEWQELFVEDKGGLVLQEEWLKPSDEVEDFLKKYNPRVEEGDVYPANLAAAEWISRVSFALTRGFVITIDYDSNLIARKGASFKERSGYSLFKDEAGKVDITTGVDFQLLVDTGKRYGLNPLGYVTEGGFLSGLGYFAEKSNLFAKFQSTIGYRRYFLDRAEKLIWSGSKVLIQSKGIEGETQLSGLSSVFHEKTSEEQRKKIFKGFEVVL